MTARCIYETEGQKCTHTALERLGPLRDFLGPHPACILITPRRTCDLRTEPEAATPGPVPDSWRGMMEKET